MTKKEEIKNNILMSMRMHLDPTTFDILNSTIVKVFYNVDVVDMETLPATRDMSNEYIWEMYMMRKASRLSSKTVEAYKIVIFEFVRYINKSFLHVEETDVEYYLLMKQREGNNTVSLNNKRRNLSAFFTWMRRMGLIQKNPAENVEKFTEIEKPIDHLTAAEFEQLKCGCRKSRDRALMEWLRCTAMRSGEIQTVKINQVNWQNGTVTIYGQKGHAYRLVCLDEVAMKYLKVYIEDRGEPLNSGKPLFVATKGDASIPISNSGILGAIKGIADRAGMQRNVYTHLFRKTTATNIVKRGGSDAEAGEYLGHKPSSVTGRHYTYKSEDRINDIFKKYVQAV